MQEWDLGDNCSQWVRRLAAQLCWPDSVRTWIAARAKVFLLPDATSWVALTRPQAFRQMKRLWAFVPVAIGGYFDDSFSGSGKVGNACFMRALLRIVREGGVRASIPKFERFCLDGARFDMDPVSYSWMRDPASLLAPQHPTVLGKEFVIKDGIRRDSEERVRVTVNLTREVIRLARASKHRLVPVTAGERLRGQWNRLTETCKLLRTLLFGLSASLAVGQRAGSRREGFARRPLLKFDMARSAFGHASGDGSSWAWSGWGVTQFFPLSYQAEDELIQLLDAIEGANAVAWLPRRSPVPRGRIGYIVNDSAGKSSIDSRSPRGAAAWLYIEGLDGIPYIIEVWRTLALDILNSSQQESANAATNLEYW